MENNVKAMPREGQGEDSSQTMRRARDKGKRGHGRIVNGKSKQVNTRLPVYLST
jgi:hypothetical protein